MKLFLNKHTIVSILVLAIFLQTTSCKKEHSCYSKELEESTKDNYCPTVSMHFLGCDGKMYGNECEAAKVGIRGK
jgi:hypothetical protein